MSLLDKALSKLLGDVKEDKADANEHVTKLPVRDLSVKINEDVDAVDSELAKTAMADNDIDIRLDQDLTDFQLPVDAEKDISVDFDLNERGRGGDAFAETQVMSVNPLKSFSNRIDINLRWMTENGYITPDSENLMLSNTFRTLKRPVLNNVAGKGATVLDNANLIMVSSSFSGEGKTYTTINLALSIAMERDKKVLLIDADVSKPSHHHIYGLENDDGLTDLLLGNVDDVSEVIRKTNIPSLSVMYAGTRSQHATELFASNAMEAFLTELSQRYDDRIIVFDSAPLLLPTEASVLAQNMGQVVLVVEAENTRIEDAKKSRDMLENRIVLMVLNKTRESGSGSYYGYGAYGAYGAAVSE
ncbi:MAG: protein-tyrosine kinase [Gammaproteobacteria bacterium]|jgi:protein-tyrosine kinase